jgi:uncharacterized membrane protein HdeD (DUF308 family)
MRAPQAIREEACMTSAPTFSPLARAELLSLLARNWWLILLRGIFAVVFGLIAFGWPGLTLLTLVLLFGAYALLDGAVAIWAGIAGGDPAPRWWLLLVGLVGVAAGVVALLLPGFTALMLLLFIAAWAITIGVMQIIGAIRLRKEIENEWLLVTGGVVSILFGMVLLLQPAAGVLGVVYIIASYAVVYGLILIVFALRIRRQGAAAAT